jgi:hypothetical protein
LTVSDPEKPSTIYSSDQSREIAPASLPDDGRRPQQGQIHTQLCTYGYGHALGVQFARSILIFGTTWCTFIYRIGRVERPVNQYGTDQNQVFRIEIGRETTDVPSALHVDAVKFFGRDRAIAMSYAGCVHDGVDISDREKPADLGSVSDINSIRYLCVSQVRITGSAYGNNVD